HFANRYIEREAPWKLHKEGKEKEVENLLYRLLDNARLLSFFLYPFMPDTTLKLRELLGLQQDPGKESLEESLCWQGGPEVYSVEEAQPLFPRIIE
ncbi:MAG TPA: methionine--tRNA ligase, partial [Candidatus Atribacteria bacterium]|nr:methionine--tRNA ligase [Candidatus Atribacteria bacterium]HQD33639.1 methionine--tRNA ligase [Candidatus Atribacteria bacterium]